MYGIVGIVKPKKLCNNLWKEKFVYPKNLFLFPAEGLIVSRKSFTFTNRSLWFFLELENT